MFEAWGIIPFARRSDASAQKQSGCAAGYPAGARKKIVVDGAFHPGGSGTSGTVTSTVPSARRVAEALGKVA